MSAKNLSVLSIVLTGSLLLGGCSSWFKKEVDPLAVDAIPVQKVQLNLADPDPLSPRKVQWFIITPENADEVFADLKKKKYDLVLFGLTDDGYTNLSLNLAEIRAYLLEQKGIIKAYKEYYEPVKTVPSK